MDNRLATLDKRLANMDTPSKVTSAPQHRLFDVSRFTQDIATRMPSIKESSRRMQVALGVELGTRIVFGKCWEMPRPPRMEYDSSDDDIDEDNDDGDDEEGSEEYYGGGSDDRKSVMDEQDIGHCDDGEYDDDDDETEDASPSPEPEVQVHEDTERLEDLAEEDESEDELSSDADVRSIDWENIEPRMQQPQYQGSQSVKARRVVQSSQHTGKRKFASQHDQDHRASVDKNAPPRNYWSVPQGRRRRSNEPVTQEPDAIAASLPAESEQTVDSSTSRLRPTNIIVPTRHQSHANDHSAKPTINLIEASPRPSEQQLMLSDRSAQPQRLMSPQSTPLAITVPYNVIEAWLRNLPPMGQFADPFVDAQARLAALTYAYGPEPPLESILAISAPVQVRTLQRAAMAAQARQLDHVNIPVRRPVPGPIDPRLATQGRPSHAPFDRAPSSEAYQQKALQQRQSTLPRLKAPLNPTQQLQYAPHPQFKTPTHVPASPPPVYRSPPRLANRLEAPSYWSSTLSTTLYCWHRNAATRSLQTPLLTLALTSLSKPSDPASPAPLLRYDANFFAKLKWSRMRLPEDGRCASRAVPIRDWYTLELMSDTHEHGPAALARNDPNQSLPFNPNPHTTKPSLLPPTSLPSPEDKPYWLMAFPVTAVTDVQSRQFFTGAGVVTKTRVRVGREGRVPLLHGRSVNPWFLEHWVSAFSSGEAVIEVVSELGLAL